MVPLPSDIDPWRSAGIMIRQRGSRAPTAASDRAKRLEASGDKDGAAAATWRLIAQWPGRGGGGVGGSGLLGPPCSTPLAAELPPVALETVWISE